MIVVECIRLGSVHLWWPWIMGDGVDRSEGSGVGSAQRDFVVGVVIGVVVVGVVSDVGDGCLCSVVSDQNIYDGGSAGAAQRSDRNRLGGCAGVVQGGVLTVGLIGVDCGSLRLRGSGVTCCCCCCLFADTFAASTIASQSMSSGFADAVCLGRGDGAAGGGVIVVGWDRCVWCFS